MFQQTKNLGRLRVARQEKQVLPFEISTDWSFPFWPSDEQPRSSALQKRHQLKLQRFPVELQTLDGLFSILGT